MPTSSYMGVMLFNTSSRLAFFPDGPTSFLEIFRKASAYDSLIFFPSASPFPVEKELKIGKFEGWQEYNSPALKFKVFLPGQPQYTTETLPIPNTPFSLYYHLYVAEEGDGTTLMVSIIRYPDGIDTSNKEPLLKNVMNEMVTSDPGNSLRSLEIGTFRGYQSLDFKIENSDVLIINKAFMVAKDLFLLTLIDKTGNFREAEFSYFIDSFQLVKD